MFSFETIGNPLVTVVHMYVNCKFVVTLIQRKSCFLFEECKHYFWINKQVVKTPDLYIYQ